MSKNNKPLPWWAKETWWSEIIAGLSCVIVGSYIAFCVVVFAHDFQSKWNDSYEIDIFVTSITHTNDPNIDIVATQSGEKYELKMFDEYDFIHDVMRRHMHAENEYHCYIRGHRINPWGEQPYLSYCRVDTDENN